MRSVTQDNKGRFSSVFERSAAVLLLSLLSLLSLVFSAPDVVASDTVQSPQQMSAAIETSPVTVDHIILFYLRGIRAYPAAERAREIADRIVKVASDPRISANAVVVAEGDNMTNIVAGNFKIVSLVDADAQLEGVTRQQLAAVYVEKVRAAIEEYRQARTRENIVRGFLYAASATIVFIVATFLIFRLHRKLHTFLESHSKKRIRELEMRSVKLFGAEGIWGAVEDALKTVRLIAVLVAFYVYLETALGFFPWTRFYAVKLLELVIGPLKILGAGILKHIPDLIFIVVLVLIVRLFLKFTHIFFKEIEVGARKLPAFYPEWARPTDRLLTFVVIAFAAVVAFPYIPGSGTAAFKGISIFIGILFSLGSQSAISNTIAGFIVQYRRAFKVGDWISINDITGDVAAIRMQVTHIQTIKNEDVIVPNSTILNSHIVNYSSLALAKGLILHTEVTIGYDAPWRQVYAMLLAAAGRTSGLLKEPSPFVIQKSLEDFYVRYELNAYTDAPQMMFNIYSELHAHIQDSFNEHGVQIMSPHYLEDPSTAKIVPKEKWFKPPADGTSQ